MDDLAGLSRSHPGVALLMVVFLFSLIGIPLTAGFAGKFLLFLGAMSVPGVPSDPTTLEQARLFRILALIGVLNAAIGAWYYLRIVAVMYLRNPLRPAEGRGRLAGADGHRDLRRPDDCAGRAAAAGAAGRHDPRRGAAGATRAGGGAVTWPLAASQGVRSRQRRGHRRRDRSCS